MATFPTYVKLDWRSLQETPEPVVLRAEMERGIPKQRRANSDVRVEMQLQMEFDSPSDAASFETWFYDTIDAGQDFFDFTHPRTATVVQARFVGGQIGPLQYRNRALGYPYRVATIEYWKSTW